MGRLFFAIDIYHVAEYILYDPRMGWFFKNQIIQPMRESQQRWNEILRQTEVYKRFRALESTLLHQKEA